MSTANRNRHNRKTAWPVHAVTQPITEPATPGYWTQFIDEELPLHVRNFIVGDGDSFDEWGIDQRGYYLIATKNELLKFCFLQQRPKIVILRFMPRERDPYLSAYDVSEAINALGQYSEYKVAYTVQVDCDDRDTIMIFATDDELFTKVMHAKKWFERNSSIYYKESRFYKE